ncbi:hypothetical protein O6H91_Y355600 [Diphasiastrum complanatum]|nr:hypothetical protein O6H91_Y355600 [Diphasiastrum complanatum]
MCSPPPFSSFFLLIATKGNVMFVLSRSARIAALRQRQQHRPPCLDLCALLLLQRRSVHWGGPGEGRVSYLRNPESGAELFLVGTAHVSSKSAEEVREVIHKVKPDIVAIELCEERARNLMRGADNITLNFRQVLRELMKYPGGWGQKILHLFFKVFYQMMRDAGFEPGMEFKV